MSSLNQSFSPYFKQGLTSTVGVTVVDLGLSVSLVEME